MTDEQQPLYVHPDLLERHPFARRPGETDAEFGRRCVAQLRAEMDQRDPERTQ